MESNIDINKHYLLVSKKYPYQAYAVGSKEYVEKQAKCEKYQKGYYIREAIDNHDGCYRIEYSGGLRATIGFLAFEKALNDCFKENRQIKFIGTERDWLVMQKQDVCIQDSIRGFGKNISQKWSKELYKNEL
jgi:hypothetical protein